MSVHRHNTILSVNIDKQLNLIPSLSKAAEEIQPLIIAIQDPPNMTECQRNITFTNYFPNMLIANASKHHIILTDRNLPIGIPDNASFSGENTSYLSIQFKLRHTDSNNYIINSVYLKPKADAFDIKNCLDKIETLARNTYGLSRSITLGDSNATSNLWSPISDLIPELDGKINYNHNNNNTYQQKKINKGNQLNNFISRTKLTCLNRVCQGSTFTSHANQGNRESYIDIILTGSRAIKTWSEFSAFKYSDEAQHKLIATYTPGPKPHQPYLDALEKSCTSAFVKRPNLTRKLTRFKRISESHFSNLNRSTNYLKHDWTKLPEKNIWVLLNQTTNLLYKELIRVQNEVTITLKPLNISEPLATHNIRTINNINRQMRRNLTKLSRLQNKLKTIKHRDSTTTQQLTNMSKIKAQINKAKAKAINNIEQELFIKTANNRLEDILLKNNIDHYISINQHSDLWKTVRQAYHTIEQSYEKQQLYAPKIQPTLSHTTTQQLNQTPTNNLIRNREELNKVLNEKFPHKDRAIAETITSNLNRHEKEIISTEEIEKAINGVKNKKYTGPEGLKFQTLVHSIPYVKEIIHNIAKMSFYIGRIPTICNNTQGTLIPKKNPGQYRIVHIASPLTALLEIIALNRFEYLLENNKLFNYKQYGFTALKGRHDLFSRMLENIITNKKESGELARSSIISLDIEGAFDNINQNAIISKLDKDLGEQDPTAIKWISNFILSRQIKITYNDMTSSIRKVCMGVPQGSSLGPILFNYTINDIDNRIRKTKDLECLAYADDLILISNNDKSFKQHQPLIDDLSTQLEKFDLKIKPQKCSYMTIINNDHDYISLAPTIKGTKLERVNKMTILGIPLTNNLKYQRNNSTINQKIQLNIEKLTRLRQLNIINNKIEWKTLLQSYIYSLTIYNSFPILAIDKGARQWLDKLHAKAIRTIFGWPANCSIKTMRLITGCPTTESEIRVILQSKEPTEHWQAYELLLNLMMLKLNTIKHTQLSQYYPKIEPAEKIEKRLWLRRYANPKLYLKPPQHLLDNQIHNTDFWIIETTPRIRAIELTNKLINPTTITFDHWCKGSRNSYFKEATALWNLVSANDDQKSRTWLTTEKNTLLSALYNNKSNHWLTISLREKLTQNGWSIMIATYEQLQYVNDVVYNKRDTVQPSPWYTKFTELRTTNPDYTRAYLKTSCKYVAENMRRIAMFDNHNLLTNHIDTRDKSWINYPPSMINSSNILMLSGLANRENGAQLEQALVIPGPYEAPMGCTNTCKRAQQGIPTLHRLLECPRFSSLRTEFDKALKKSTSITSHQMNNDLNSLNTAFESFKTRQTIIRYMTKCAFNKE